MVCDVRRRSPNSSLNKGPDRSSDRPPGRAENSNKNIGQQTDNREEQHKGEQIQKTGKDKRVGHLIWSTTRSTGNAVCD